MRRPLSLGSQVVRDARGEIVDTYVSYLASVRCALLPDYVLNALARQADRARAVSLN
jgi:hypothetical protein